MIVFFFIVIACMRVVQSYSGKQVSMLTDTRMKFFEYGAYYQFVSAALSVVLLIFGGFYGFDVPTALCSLLTALLFAVNLYASMEALKGGTLVLCSMFSQGGLFVPCFLGIFLFDEPMSVFQWIGLAAFVCSAGLLASGSNQVSKKLTARTVVMLFFDLLANGFVMVVQKYFALLVPNGNVAVYSFMTFAFNATILFGCALCLFLFGRKKAKSVAKAALYSPERAGAGEIAEQEKPIAETESSENTVRKYPFEKLHKKHYIFGAALGLAVFLINILVTTLSKTVPSVVLFPISSAISLSITTLIGAVVYKEKLTVKNLFGVLLGLASIIVMNVL